jgi:hypothetical protein
VKRSGEPRYLGVEVSTRSENPIALIAAVRHALRQAGVDRDEIGRFSDLAFDSADPAERLAVCSSWVSVCHPSQ